MRSRTNDNVQAADVHAVAAQILGRSLRLIDHGVKCTVHTILLVLFFAASRCSSIFDACQRLKRAPTDQAVRNALIAMLPAMPQLESRLNIALRAKLPIALRRKARAMAVDFTQVPYYGRHFEQPRELRRGKRRQ